MPEEILSPGQDTWPDGVFLLPVCTTRERLSRTLSTLFEGGVLLPLVNDVPESDANVKYDTDDNPHHPVTTERFDHIIDILEAIGHIADPTDAFCFLPTMPDEQSCQDFAPSAGFIDWFPNNPFLDPDEVGDGYANPAWYLATTASNIAYGSDFGDVITSIDRFPPGSLPDVLPTSGLPRFRINVMGEGTVKATLVNMFAGSLIQTTVDDDIGTIRFVDVARETIALPPETQTELTVEFALTTPGAHFIDFIVISWVNSSVPFIHHGGGLRKVELCGFETMPVTTPPFRFTALCGLEFYNGEAWTPVDGWTEFAPICFTGEPGTDGVDGDSLFVRENLATGLEQDDNPAFTSPTLIHAYYRADALRRAVAFYAQAADANLAIFNVAGVQQVRLGITPAGGGAAAVTLDARNATGGLRIWAAGSGSNRSMYFDPVNGRVSIETGFPQAVAIKAQFLVSAGSDTDHSIRSEGRALNSVAQIVAYRSADTATGDLFAGDLNAQGKVFRVTNEAELIFRNYMSILKKRSGIATNVEMHVRETQFAEDSGSNWRSRVIDKVRSNVGIVETMRQETISDAAAIGFLGAAASNRIVLTGNAEGSQLLLDIANALDTFGLFEASALTLGENCCAEVEACNVYDFVVAPYNSDWNIIDGTWIDGYGYAPTASTDAIRINMIFSPDIEMTYIRVAGTNPAMAVGPTIIVRLDSTDIFNFGPSSSTTPWFGSSGFTPSENGAVLEVEVICDIDDPVFLTEVEIHYREVGGHPSGGITCNA